MTDLSPKPELIFTITALCSPPEELGQIDGGAGRMIPIDSGTVVGPKFNGTVMPGADWAIMRENGVATVDARYAIKSEDGTIIQVFNGATAAFDPASVQKSGVAMITCLRFIAPKGPHDWLNQGVYVGTLSPDMTSATFTVRIGVYKMGVP